MTKLTTSRISDDAAQRCATAVPGLSSLKKMPAATQVPAAKNPKHTQNPTPLWPGRTRRRQNRPTETPRFQIPLHLLKPAGRQRTLVNPHRSRSTPPAPPLP